MLQQVDMALGIQMLRHQLVQLSLLPTRTQPGQPGNQDLADTQLPECHSQDDGRHGDHEK